jgi:hypothetical protein
MHRRLVTIFSWSMMMKQKTEEQQHFASHSLYHHVYDLLEAEEASFAFTINHSSHITSNLCEHTFSSAAHLSLLAFPSFIEACVKLWYGEPPGVWKSWEMNYWEISFFLPLRKGWMFHHAWREQKNFCGNSTIYQLIPPTYLSTTH